MAKESGIGATLNIDDSGGTPVDVSNDVASIQIGTPQNLLEVTGLDKSAIERLIGLADGQVQVTGNAFNDAATSLWTVIKTRTGTRTVALAISGQTLSMEMLISDVGFARNADGGWVPTATFMLQSGTVPAWS